MNAPRKSFRLSDSNSESVNFEVELIGVDQITDGVRNIWRQLRESRPEFSSPYFDLEFVLAVARVRSDVEIAVLRNERHEIVGLLPFQRTRPWHAEPIGGRLNDLQGVIGAPGMQFDMLEVLRQVGLSSFSFHALTNGNVNSDRFEFNKQDSYFVDLSRGWNEYHRWAKKHSSTVKKQDQKSRAMNRDLKDVRFEFDCDSRQALEQLIRLKRQKYSRENTFDILSVDWASELLREIHSVSSENFQGILSVLWDGDTMIAGHMGMISGNILHYWFPAFDTRYARYSPGSELILRVAKAAAEQGFTMMDFGYGDDPYKFKFCNGRGRVTCGVFRFSRVGFYLAKHRFDLRNRLKGIPMKPVAKTVLRSVFPGFGHWNFK